MYPDQAPFKADLEACFLPDQELADSVDGFVAALEKKDWTTVIATIKKFVPSVSKDIQPCETPQYQKVDDAYHDEQKLVETVKADPDFQAKMGKQAFMHMKDLKSNMADFQAKWDSGDYYGSGVAIGNIEMIIMKPWMNSYEGEFLQ